MTMNKQRISTQNLFKKKTKKKTKEPVGNSGFEKFND